MATVASRVEKLEAAANPQENIIVIWDDPEGGKAPRSAAELAELEASTPGLVVIRVRYVNCDNDMQVS